MSPKFGDGFYVKTLCPQNSSRTYINALSLMSHTKLHRNPKTNKAKTNPNSNLHNTEKKKQKKIIARTAVEPGPVQYIANTIPLSHQGS